MPTIFIQMTCGDNSAIAQNFKGKIQIKSNTDLYKIKRQDKAPWGSGHPLLTTIIGRNIGLKKILLFLTPLLN